MGDKAGKRFFLTLEKVIAEELERWGNAEGFAKPTSFANHLITEAVLQARRGGKIPPPNEQEGVEAIGLTEVRAFLKKLSSGVVPDPADILELAHELDIDEDVLFALIQRLGNGNGHREGCHESNS